MDDSYHGLFVPSLDFSYRRRNSTVTNKNDDGNFWRSGYTTSESSEIRPAILYGDMLSLVGTSWNYIPYSLWFGFGL